ncbi:restriction endonuclease subunit S [Polaromonas sp. CG_23.6]|uniref:restriction endonuclease subunit S n=1 Tax=Polaromonas sp. CG_23.6 TaxID=2760709 RepID=UPI0024759461|nr:restriction endonuclease subunit S [Polaromonas sp. CG_23.6]MDH6186745.1 type I restriction enzyme S subunit [Polaromonas sp. CG_23.6]
MSHYKPYPAYKDSGVEWIGRVPEHWEVKRLRHVASFSNSNVDKKSYEGQDEVSLCNYTDVYKNEFITPGMPFMKATGSLSEIEQFTLQKGDVLITKDSEDPTDIGIPSLVAQDMPGVVCGYHLTIIRPDNLPTSRLVHRVLMSAPTKAHFFLEAPGITRYGLGQDAIGDLTVCLPPESERSLIADRIDRETTRIDSLITKKTRFIELLKEKRQALITHAVTKGLDPSVKMKDSGVEWIGEVPEHWAVSRLGHFATVENGTTPSKGNVAFWEAGNIPWVGSGEVNQGFVNEATENITELALRSCSLRLLPVDTVLVGMVGQGKTRGLAAILKIAATINQNLAAICTGQRLMPMFLVYFFGAAYEWIREAGRGSNQAAMNCEIVGEFRLAIPSAEEQALILSKLAKMTLRIDLLSEKSKRSIALLRERRSAFITAAITGQIDLRRAA